MNHYKIINNENSDNNNDTVKFIYNNNDDDNVNNVNNDNQEVKHSKRILSIDLHRGLLYTIAMCNFTEYLSSSPTNWKELDLYVAFDFAGRLFTTIIAFAFGVNLYIWKIRGSRKGFNESQLRQQSWRRSLLFLIMGFLFNLIVWWPKRSLWDVDVLVFYSVCAFLFPFIWNLSTKKLLSICGIIFILAWYGHQLPPSYNLRYWTEFDSDHEYGQHDLDHRTITCARTHAREAIEICYDEQSYCASFWGCVEDCVEHHQHNCIPKCHQNTYQPVNWVQDTIWLGNEHKLSMEQDKNKNNNKDNDNNSDNKEKSQQLEKLNDMEYEYIKDIILNCVSNSENRLNFLSKVHSISELIVANKDTLLLDHITEDLSQDCDDLSQFASILIITNNHLKLNRTTKLIVLQAISEMLIHPHWEHILDMIDFPKLFDQLHDAAFANNLDEVLSAENLRWEYYLIEGAHRYELSLTLKEMIREADGESIIEEVMQDSAAKNDIALVFLIYSLLGNRCISIFQSQFVSKATPNVLLESFEMFINGILYDGHYAIIPWIIFPIVGYMSSRTLMVSKNFDDDIKRRTTLRNLSYSFGSIVIIWISIILYYKSKSESYVMAIDDALKMYPHSTILYVFWGLACNFFLMWKLEIYNDPSSKQRSGWLFRFILGPCSFLNRYLLTYYVVQHIVIMWPNRFLSYWRYNDQFYYFTHRAVTVLQSAIFGTLYTIIMYFLLQYWEKRYQAKYTLEWWLRRFQNTSPNKPKTY